MRLLIVTTIPATLKAFLLPYAQHFRARGWRVDALAGAGDEWDSITTAFNNTYQLPFSRNPLDRKNLFEVAPRIRALVKEHGYDIVHVHTPVAAFVTRWALRNWRRDKAHHLIYTAHGFHFHPQGHWLKNLAFRTLEQLGGRWTDELIVINQDDYQAAIAARLVPPGRIHFMPGIGVDTNALSRKNLNHDEVQKLANELGASNSCPALLMIAEFNSGKRHRDALLAFSQSQFLQAKLLFAGDGPEVSAMRDLAESLGIANQVYFLGKRGDIPQLLGLARAVILPSEREGLPRSILEAMSMGVPVIGTAIRGIKDLLAPTPELLVNVGDISGLAKAMTLLLQNPARAEELGGRLRGVVGQYDVGEIIKLHEILYNRLRVGSEYKSEGAGTAAGGSPPIASNQ